MRSRAMLRREHIAPPPTAERHPQPAAVQEEARALPQPWSLTNPDRLPEHAMAQAKRREAILQLQETRGNGAVCRKLAGRGVQRQAVTDARQHTTLRNGAQGPEVTEMQRRLNLHGAKLAE